MIVRRSTSHINSSTHDEVVANKCADLVRHYWIMKGYAPKIWVERLGGGSGRMVTYGVRSELVDGRPPEQTAF